LLASRVLGRYAMLSGMDCKLSEVHGMAQRGGSVVTHIKAGKAIHSPVITEGEADIILAFELLEAKRWLHYLKPGGKLLVNSRRLLPMPVITGAAKYPEGLEQELESAGALLVDGLAAAKAAGSEKALNIYMLGVLCAALSLDRQRFTQAVCECVPQKALEINLRALEAGLAEVK